MNFQVLKAHCFKPKIQVLVLEYLGGGGGVPVCTFNCMLKLGFYNLGKGKFYFC